MSQSIRSLTPKACPACGTTGRFARIQGQLKCQVCGYTASTAATPPPAPIPQPEKPPIPHRTQTGELKRLAPRTTTTEIPAVKPPAPQPPSTITQTGELKRLKPRTTTELPVVKPSAQQPPTPPTQTSEFKRIKPKPASAQPPTDTQPKKPAYKPFPIPTEPPPPAGYSPEHLERLKKFPVSEALLHRESISQWAQAIFSTGIQHLRKQEWADAAKSFRRAVGEERDFVDAHLWLARLSLTEKEQREHWSAVLALMPNHVEATTSMMVLNGQMTHAEANRANNPHNSPATQQANAPIATDAKLMKCPNCGGRTKAGDDGQSVVCEFCGHKEARVSAQDYGFKSLSMALLKQRGQAVQWVVGKRLLKCQTCGAERTLQHGTLSERCLFCGSSYVVKADALGSFQQPDGMLKFAVNKQKAGELLQEALKSGLERVKGWFVNQEVGRIELETLYVPFWLFDFTLDIRRTFTRKGGPNQSSRHLVHPPVRYETMSEMAHDVPVVASKEVDRKLIAKAGRFVLDRVQPYHPDLLASHSALIYSLPFDKAAILAQQMTSERMRMMYEEGTSEEAVSVSLLFQQSMFRLVLMPFWVATMFEADGDLRPALVNGQTGGVALGKAYKPKA